MPSQSNLLTAEVFICGTRPLLWCHFGPEALSLEKRERSGRAGNEPDEWRRTVLVAEDGRLYLDPTQIFGLCRDAARYTRKGRGSIQAPLAATLQVLDELVYTDQVMPLMDPPLDRHAPVYIDVRTARNPTTRKANIRYRIAASAGWRATFRLMWDKTIISRGEMEAVLRDAGQLVGVGDGRTIGFGRFTVESMAILSDAQVSPAA